MATNVSFAPVDEVDFVARRIWTKVFNSHPDRLSAARRAAEEAIAALQDYTPIAEYDVSLEEK